MIVSASPGCRHAASGHPVPPPVLLDDEELTLDVAPPVPAADELALSVVLPLPPEPPAPSRPCAAEHATADTATAIAIILTSSW
jgi:hypothetical protein